MKDEAAAQIIKRGAPPLKLVDQPAPAADVRPQRCCSPALAAAGRSDAGTRSGASCPADTLEPEPAEKTDQSEYQLHIEIKGLSNYRVNCD